MAYCDDALVTQKSPTAGKKGHSFDGFDLFDRLRSLLTPLSVYLTSHSTISSFWIKIKMNAIVLLHIENMKSCNGL